MKKLIFPFMSAFISFSLSSRLANLAFFTFLCPIAVYADDAAAAPSAFRALDGTLTGNTAITSNYIWRGLTQTDGGPAVQGSLTYTHDSGFYGNVWGSNVNFGPDDASDARLELDASLGYKNTIFKNINYDIGVVRYAYPKTEHLDYNEAYLKLGYSIFTVGVNYSNDIFASDETGTYYNAGISYDMPAAYLYNIDGINLSAAIGRSKLPADISDNYTDYQIALTKTFKNRLALQIAWVDTVGYKGEIPRDHLIGTLTLSL